MLSILGAQRRSFCDRVARRDFLRVGSMGSLGLGGISLAHLLRAESLAEGRTENGGRQRDKSVIMVYLPGGPTQHETFDPKPNAPREIRGSFASSSTAIPGVHFCELLPKLSRIANKFSVVRTLTGMLNRHEAFPCYTGRPGGKSEDNEPAGGWPTLGSCVSHVLGPAADGIVPYVDVTRKMRYAPYNNRGTHHPTGSSWPGFTGPQHTPFTLEGDVRSDLVLQGVDLNRFNDRRAFLSSLNDAQRAWDVEGVDSFQRQAFDMLTNSRLAEALDLEKEDKKVLARYGEVQSTHSKFGGAPQNAHQLLLTRRLVEAGVRCVTVAFGAWDWHGNREGTIEYLSNKYLPVFDHALAALIEDLDERGLLSDVSVVVWGEFGRTPRINAKGGRDHWPETQSVLLAGGGMLGGRIVGATDRSGGSPISRPVHVQEVFASLYRNLGIDTNAVKIHDLSGRPRYLVDANRQPIRELYS